VAQGESPGRALGMRVEGRPEIDGGRPQRCCQSGFSLGHGYLRSVRTGQPPGWRTLLPPEGSNPSQPSSVSRASRRDLQRPGRKGAPERIDKAGIQQIGTVTQPLCRFRLVPISGAASLGAKLNRLGHNGPRLKSIGDRVAPSHSAMTGGPGKNQALVAIKDRQKLWCCIGAVILSMLKGPLHGVGQGRETLNNHGGSGARHQGRGRPVHPRQRERQAGIRNDSRAIWNGPHRARTRLARQGKVKHGNISNGAESHSPRLTVTDQTATLFLEGAAAIGPDRASEFAETPQAQLRSGTYDDVVMQRQAEKLAALLDLLGHAEIGLGRRGIARRVIVDLLRPVFLCAPPSRSAALSMASEPRSGT